MRTVRLGTILLLRIVMVVLGLLVSRPSLAQETLSYDAGAEHDLALWKPDGAGPFPFVMFIHGGAFVNGDKSELPDSLRTRLLDAGLAVASINYRLGKNARFPAPMMDGVRALQFLRSKAAELGLNATKVVLMGGSAGAGIALWIAFHPDLADRNTADPVLRQSTRVNAVAVFDAQTTYTPLKIREIFGASVYPGFLPRLFGVPRGKLDDPSRQAEFDRASPLTFYTADDPPAYLVYRIGTRRRPVDPSRPASYIHNMGFARPLQDLARRFGTKLTVETVPRRDPDAAAAELARFAIAEVGK
jgi:acetyl esterase